MCQIGTSSSHGGRRKLPYVFTEQGVAMLSGVLPSERAVAVNVAIMRAFVAMLHELASHSEAARKLDALEQALVVLERASEEKFSAGDVYAMQTNNRDDFAPRSATILRGLLDEAGVPAAGGIEPPPVTPTLF